MGMRSPDKASGSRAASAEPAAAPNAPGAPARRPALLMMAAAALALEAAGLAVTGVLTAYDAATGRSYQVSSGIALTIFVFVVVAGLAWIASGVARVRPWSRTPAVMTQLVTGIVAVWLLQAHRFDWGIPALLLAVAGLVALLIPASLRALTRQVNRQ